MKNNLLAILCFFNLFQSEQAFSQTQPNCAADILRETTLQDSVFFQKNQAFEDGVLKYFEQKKTSPNLSESAEMKTIPVVIHIIHDGGPENISDAQAQQAIVWLNQALANQGNFNQGSGADCGIQLCLAQRTPDNLPTNGITRNQSPLTEMQMESQDLQVKNLNRWETKDYVNIWLVRKICSNTYGCNVYGYANYPYAHGSNIDGIVIEAGFVTELGKISGLAHEVGHYLGLYHTFEGGCTNNNCQTQGDRICDTPPDQSTASVPCGQTVNTCTTDTQSGPFTSDQPDMTWNFLDYGILACFHDYTPDQATRMNATLDGIRKSLLESKGCLPPCPANTVASFTASATTIVVGGTVNFSNTSQNAGAYQWAVNGIPFGSQANANYTFLAPGTYTVLLTAQPSNNTLCEPDDFQLTIQVYCSVTASFTVSDLAPDQDETITLTNTSQNATQTEWFVNGVSQGPTLDSLVFSAAGVYEIRLETGNVVCGSSATEVVYVQELCLNKTFESNVFLPFQSQAAGSITVLTDGNLLMASIVGTVEFESPAIVKMKPSGQVIWAKEVGMDSTRSQNVVVRASPDGGFFAFYEKRDMPASDTSQYYLAKLSANGSLLWARRTTGPSSSQATNIIAYADMLVNTDGSVIVSGPFLAKFSASGDLVWAIENTWLTKIAAYPDGGFLAMAATFTVTTLIRYDGDANVLWAKELSTTNIELKTLLAMPSGEIFMAGKQQSGITPYTFLMKLTPEGELVWSKSYRQIPVSSYQFEAMTYSASGNLIIAGHARADDPGPGNFNNYSLLVEIDMDGNLVWSRHRPNAFHANEIVALPSEGYAVIGEFLRVLKTNQLGETPNCPELPHTINIEEYLGAVSSTNVVQNVTLLPIESVTPSVTDLPWLIDTVCVSSCFEPFEICNNNLDDDGDGLFDCLDSDCDCTEDECSPQQANIWYFGYGAGLDFSTDPPKVLSDGLSFTNDITSTMCDTRGNLLFYADGHVVYNRFHQPMPNGNIPFGGESIIVPHPGDPGLFYLILTSEFNGIRIYIVDMKLDNGRGDIVNPLLAAHTNGLAATRACSFNGYWLLTRRPTDGTTLEDFWAVKIDEDGLNTSIIYSNVGQALDEVGNLKISPDGKRAACSYDLDGKYYLAIYDFDPYSSGAVTNPRVLKFNQDPDWISGAEFSPNSRFLYASGYFANDAKVLQFDLEAGDVNAISNSMTVLYSQSTTSTGGIPQLAPNGKIYVPINETSPSTFLDVIHSPNNPGIACQYQKKGLNFGPTGMVWSGLCNVISSYLNTPRIAFPHDAPDTICSLNTPIFYQIKNVQCGVDSIKWQAENLSVQIQPNYQYATIRYLNPGTGRLIVIAYTPCGISTDTLDVLVVAPLNKILNLGPNLVVCDNGVFSFNAGEGFARYQWSDGTSDSTTTTLFPGKYWVNVWDLCGHKQTDTITISIAPNSVLDLGPDLPQQCSGVSSNFQRPANFESWLWSPDIFLSCTNCPSVTLSPTTNATWVVVGQTIEGCVSVDTLRATIRDTLLFSRDTTVCIGQTLSLFGAQLPADTSAQFFLPAPGIGCDTILTVNILGIENEASELSVTICPHAFFDYNGTLLPADTVAIFQFASSLACDSAVTVRVNAFPPLTLVLPMDTTIRIGASVLLEAETIGAGTLDFVWSPSEGLSCVACPDPLANPLDTITYTLAVTDANGCTAQESVTVRVNEECRVRIPTAFTPNGDGSNDRFRPLMDPCVRTLRLWKILNRWGQTVFEQINFAATDPNLGWDGNWEGKAQASDVLIWVAEFEYFDGRRESQHGQVTLVR